MNQSDRTGPTPGGAGDPTGAAEPLSAPPSSAPTPTADDGPAPDADAAREAAALRRDREKAERQAARERGLARRDEENAERQARKDAEKARKDAERLERDRRRVEDDAARQAERDRKEREQQARAAAKEAGRAQREAEAAERAAALARQRAEREAAKARRQAERAEDPADTGQPEIRDLPPDLAVLWRAPAPPRRGPRPSLTLEQIADAAIALADAEGLDGVSMARLAESLGFTTMSLYRYVSSKDEVLMLMSDRAAGRPPVVDATVGDWRARLEVLLGVMQPALAAHPWMSRTTTVLFAIGPNRLAWMEALVAALEDTPLTELEKLEAVGALSSYQLERVRLVEADAARRRAIAAAGGDVDADPNAVIGRLLSPRTHPAMARALAAGVFDAPVDATSVDGLDLATHLVLDGIAALVARRAGQPPAT